MNSEIKLFHETSTRKQFQNSNQHTRLAPNPKRIQGKLATVVAPTGIGNSNPSGTVEGVG